MDRVADRRAPEARPVLWKLPDAVLFQVVTFVAPPTHRAAVLCHQMAPLSRDASQAILREGDALWEVVLREDYGVRDYSNTSGGGESRRACKRLRRSVMQRVKGAHRKWLSASWLGNMVASLRLRLLPCVPNDPFL
jgi:hypothetical protein